MLRTLKVLFFFMLVMVAVSVWGQDDDITEIVGDPAPVDSVMLEDEAVVVSGFLPDGCTSLGETSQTIDDNTITIELLTVLTEGVSCVQMLIAYEETIPIETDDLEAGAYVVQVNGVAAPRLLVVGESAETETETGTSAQAAQPEETAEPEATESPDAPAPEDATDLTLATLDCPAPADGEAAQHINAAGRYCFLYPAAYTLDSPQPAVTVISAAEEIDGARPRLTIATADAAGRTLDDIVIENQDRFPETVLTFAETTIGGQPALLTERIPGRMDNRQAFILWQDTLYTLAAQPIDAELEAATAATNSLWSQVVDSFVFYSGVTEAELDALGIVVTYPARWTLDDTDGTYTLRRSADSALVFSNRADLPTSSVEAIAEAILDLLLTSGESELSFEAVTVAGQDAAQISGISDGCRLLLIPDAANERVLSIRVQEPNCDGSLTSVIDALQLP